MLRAAFYKGTRPGLPGIYNRGVRFVTRGPYSHCELVFSDGISASASFMDRGVRFKTIAFDPAHWDFVSLSAALEPAARAWFAANEGKPYDLPGNIHFLFGPVPENKTAYFCSEAMAASLGFRDAWRYDPALLFSALSHLTT